MSFGFDTFNAAGNKTFNIDAKVVKEYLFQYLPANSTGIIDLSPYPSAVESQFIRSNFNSIGTTPVLPYAYRSGSNLVWQTSGHACYVSILGVLV